MEIKGYIADLVEYLKNSLAIRRNITVRMNITETELDVSYAIPVGIIITEAIVNAVKHAFPDDRSGQVKITLIADKADIFYLTIKDNGIGLKDGINLSKNKSLGVSLIKSFCDQLEAKCSFNNNEGLTIAITFKHERSVIINY
jgi:two-component sensor histidine kinase